MSGESRSVVVRLSMDTAQAIRGTREFGAEMGRAMDEAERRTRRSSAAMDDLGRSAGRMALATAGALTVMGKAAVDWESQWAGVSKTVNGTQSQLNALEGDLRGLARSMPASHQEIAATAEAAGQLGVATENITDFTKIMVEMGSATNLSADEAATSIAQFMNVMQTVPDHVDEIGNTIVALGNKGASTEAQIVAMAQRVAGAGTTIGASESDILGLSAAMANLGIQSELGGGAAQRVLVGINTQVASGGDKLEEYAKVAGMSAQEFAQAWSTDPIRAFNMLVEGLGRIQAKGGDVASALNDMGIKGTQNLQVMLRLAGSGDMLSRSLDQSAQAWEKNNALTIEYGKRAATTAAQVQVAWNQIKDAGIQAGGALLPEIAKITNGVGDVATAFGSLPGPVHSTLTTLLELTALTGGTAWFGLKVVSGINNTRDALEALTGEAVSTKQALGQAAVAAAAIGLAVGALQSTGNQIDDLKRSRDAADATVASYQDLSDALSFSNVGKYAGDLHINLQRLAQDLNQNGANGEYVTRVMDRLKESSHGFGALLQSEYGHTIGMIPGLPDLNDADKADNARKDLEKLIAKYQDGQVSGDAFKIMTDSVGGSADGAAGGTDRLAGSTGRLGEAAGLTAKQVARLVDGMEKQRDAALGAFDAETQYRQALKAAQAQAGKNNAGIRGNTDDVLANRQALSDLASAWNSQSNAVKNNEKRFREARSTFIETAEAMGVPKERAHELANAILDIPKSHVTDIHVDTSQARSAISSVGSWLASLDGRVARTYIDVIQRGYAAKRDAIAAANATGGIYPTVKAYAAGGMDRANAHMAEISRGGPIRVWAEPETGGEAYIPLANDYRRPRARAILSQTAFALGGEVSWRGPGTYSQSGGGGGEMRVSGRLQTPWGPADIEGIASRVARTEIAAERRFDRVQAGR